MIVFCQQLYYSINIKIISTGNLKIEGNIKITCGETEKELTYEAVKEGEYETISVDFDAESSYSFITIATTAKRAYIDNITIKYKE